MEVMKAAAELRGLLIHHDRAVHILESLDAYINQRRQQLYQDLDLYHSNTALQISIATGVRQMYEHYRVTSVQKVQKLSQFIIATLSPDQVEDNLTTTQVQVPITIDTIASQYTRDSTVCGRYD